MFYSLFSGLISPYPCKLTCFDQICAHRALNSRCQLHSNNCARQTKYSSQVFSWAHVFTDLILRDHFSIGHVCSCRPSILKKCDLPLPQKQRCILWRHVFCEPGGRGQWGKMLSNVEHCFINTYHTDCDCMQMIIVFFVSTVWQHLGHGRVSIPEPGSEPGYPVGPGVKEKYTWNTQYYFLLCTVLEIIPAVSHWFDLEKRTF